MATRETIMLALATLVTGVSGVNAVVRRVQNLNKAAEQPNAIVRHIRDAYSRRELHPPRRTMEVEVRLYSRAGLNPDATPDTALNALLDALDAALAPSPATGRQTLNGLVYECWIEGNVEIYPGDLDSQAEVVVPIRITIP